MKLIPLLPLALLSVATELRAGEAGTGFGTGGLPPTGFFDGVYQLVGEESGRPVSQLLRLEGEGESSVRLTACPGEPAFSARLVPAAFGEVDSLLRLERAEDPLWCQFFSNHSNYALIPCEGGEDSATLLTLWPMPGREDECPAG